MAIAHGPRPWIGRLPDEGGPPAEIADLLAYQQRLMGEITARRRQLAHFRATVQVQVALTLLQAQRPDPTTYIHGCIASTLVADLPDLDRLDRRKVVSLAGVAPTVRDGGLMRGIRITVGGRSAVRRVLSMVAVATMREMITTLNAIARTGQPWYHDAQAAT